MLIIDADFEALLENDHFIVRNFEPEVERDKV